MDTFDGLPVHVLLVHAIVVLAPVTAVLASLSAVWPAARRRLVWVVVAMALAVAVLTPITTNAGEWLEHHVERTALLHVHTSLGDTMIYFAAGLLIAAALLIVVHVRESRGHPLPTLAVAVIALAVIVISAAATIQVYRIGESGARSVWGDTTAAADPRE